MAIRVLLAVPMPLLDVLRETIAAAGDCEVAGTVTGPLDTLLAVGTHRPDVVVIGAERAGEPPGVVTHLLAEYPDVKVLCVGPDGASGYLLRPVRVPVADASPVGLLTAIRALTYE
jgi:chemotaxis response regulator CheB